MSSGQLLPLCVLSEDLLPPKSALALDMQYS